jgi:hypothetical protein
MLYTYTVENIRRMLSLVTHHEPQVVAQVGGGFPLDLDGSESSSSHSSDAALSSEDESAPAIMHISLPPRRSCRRDLTDEGVGTFGAGYTMLKKSHISARDDIPFDGKISILTYVLMPLCNDIY